MRASSPTPAVLWAALLLWSPGATAWDPFWSEDPTVQHGNDRIFWCVHTQNCLGPDGKVADDYECNETRGCYKAL